MVVAKLASFESPGRFLWDNERESVNPSFKMIELEVMEYGGLTKSSKMHQEGSRLLRLQAISGNQIVSNVECEYIHSFTKIGNLIGYAPVNSSSKPLKVLKPFFDYKFVFKFKDVTCDSIKRSQISFDISPLR